MLAPSITTSGPLPPISSSAALPAAAWATSRPVAVEPMNATPLVPGLRAISSPTTGPGPVTRLNTPGGRSASAMHCASATAHTAVDGAGVHTTALPHASAGAISSAGIVYGQFHGLITPTTPRGRRTSITRLPGENEFGSSPAEALCVLGRHPPVLDQLGDLVERLGAQGLALVERERPRQAVAARLDQVADRVHLGRALERGQPRPAVSRPSRGVDRALRVAPVALRDGGDQLTGRRARRLERLAAGARLPASTHEHLLHGLRRHFHPLGRGHGLVDTRRQLIYNRPIRPGSMDSRVRARLSSRAFVVCSMAAQHCARRGG